MITPSKSAGPCTMISGWAIIGVLRCISSCFGKGSVTRVVEQLGDGDQDFFKHPLQSGIMYPEALVTQLFSMLEKQHGDGQGQAVYKASHAAGHLAIEVVFTVFKSMDTLERLLHALPRAWSKIMSGAGQLEVVSCSKSQGVIRMVGYEAREDVWRECWRGWFRGFVEAALCPEREIAVAAKTGADERGAFLELDFDLHPRSSKRSKQGDVLVRAKR